MNDQLTAQILAAMTGDPMPKEQAEQLLAGYQRWTEANALQRAHNSAKNLAISLESDVRALQASARRELKEFGIHV